MLTAACGTGDPLDPTGVPVVPTKLLTQRLLKGLDARGITVESMYLFGSHARGEATPDSDIDVLVASPRFASKGFWARCALVGEAIGGLPEPVQVYPVTPEELEHPEPGGFLQSIRPELKLLYKRTKRRTPARIPH
jgi:hypothetical protein